MSRGTWVRSPASSPRFRLRDSHPLWWPVPGPSTIARVCNWPGRPRERPATPPPIARPWFRLWPLRSPLLRPSRLLSCPRGTEMFQFPRFASRPYPFSAGRAGITPPRFPHSDTPGSQPACGSPRLFAACHVLPRFSAPRHPPSALSSLTTIRSARRASESLRLATLELLPLRLSKSGASRSPRQHSCSPAPGGEYRARTGDLLVANQALSQLS